MKNRAIALQNDVNDHIESILSKVLAAEERANNLNDPEADVAESEINDIAIRLNEVVANTNRELEEIEATLDRIARKNSKSSARRSSSSHSNSHNSKTPQRKRKVEDAISKTSKGNVSKKLALSSTPKSSKSNASNKVASPAASTSRFSKSNVSNQVASSTPPPRRLTSSMVAKVHHQAKAELSKRYDDDDEDDQRWLRSSGANHLLLTFTLGMHTIQHRQTRIK